MEAKHPLTEAVIAYFEARGYRWPSTAEAFLFSQTEIGEVAELLLARTQGWVRNNPADKQPYSDTALAEELGDVIQMCIVVGITRDVDPVDALLNKMRRKLALPAAASSCQSTPIHTGDQK